MDIPVRPTLIPFGSDGGNDTSHGGFGIARGFGVSQRFGVLCRLGGPPNLGRRLVTWFHARHSRRLIEGTPRRRVCDLAGVARATVVGRVIDVAGDGPAVKTWREDEAEGKQVVGRATRPFTVGDQTGTVRVRVPPDGRVVAADEHGNVSRCDPPVVLNRGDTVSVTGHVVRGRGADRLLTGPKFVVAVL